jgi:hypothetical protein
MGPSDKSMPKDSTKSKRKPDISSKQPKRKQTPKKKPVSAVKSRPASPLVKAETSPKVSETSDPLCNLSIFRSQNVIMEAKVPNQRKEGNQKELTKNLLSSKETLPTGADRPQPASYPLPSPIEERLDLSEIGEDTSVSRDQKSHDETSKQPTVPLIKESAKDDEESSRSLSNPIIPQEDDIWTN